MREPRLWAGPRIALWGKFDVARFGELLLPRIHEIELGRRLRGAQVLPWSPLGPDHPVALDGGLTALPLGVWSPESAARLTAAADAVVITGSDVLTTNDGAIGADYGLSAAEALRRRLSGFFLEGVQTGYPMAWSAAGAPSAFDKSGFPRVREALRAARYLSVRDDVSRRRLLDAGIERDVIVVPDPVALAGRVFEPAVLARRLDYLRLMEWFPREGAPLVLQGSAALAAEAEPLAAVLAAAGSPPVLFIETEPADGSGFADALLPRLPGAFRLPDSASLVDILAAFSGARCFVGDSVHGHMAAIGLGVPSLFLSSAPLPSALESLGNAAPAIVRPKDAAVAIARLLGQPRAGGPPASVAARLDAHFDSLAGFAEAALAERVERDASARGSQASALAASLQDAELRLRALREAWEARSEQLAAVRLEMDERLQTFESRLEKDISSFEKRLAEMRADSERLEALLAEARADSARLEAFLTEARADSGRLEALLAEARADARRLEARLAETRADADRLGTLLAENQADAGRRIAERDARIAQALGELEAMRAEFLRFTNLRIFRFTAPLRRLYGALRRTLRRTGS